MPSPPQANKPNNHDTLWGITHDKRKHCMSSWIKWATFSSLIRIRIQDGASRLSRTAAIWLVLHTWYCIAVECSIALDTLDYVWSFAETRSQACIFFISGGVTAACDYCQQCLGCAQIRRNSLRPFEDWMCLRCMRSCSMVTRTCKRATALIFYTYDLSNERAYDVGLHYTAELKLPTPLCIRKMRKWAFIARSFCRNGIAKCAFAAAAVCHGVVKCCTCCYYLNLLIKVYVAYIWASERQDGETNRSIMRSVATVLRKCVDLRAITKWKQVCRCTRIPHVLCLLHV